MHTRCREIIEATVSDWIGGMGIFSVIPLEFFCDCGPVNVVIAILLSWARLWSIVGIGFYSSFKIKCVTISPDSP